MNPEWADQALDGVKSVEMCLTQPGGLQLLVSGFGVLLLEDSGGCSEIFTLVSLNLVWAAPQEERWFLAQPQCFFWASAYSSASL